MFKNFFRNILPRRFLPVLMLLLQAALLVHALLTGNPISQAADLILELVGIGFCVAIAAGERKNAFKIGWIIMILLAPLFGICVYLMFNHQPTTGRFRRAEEKSCREVAPLRQLPGTETPEPGAQSAYLAGQGFPLYGSTGTQFYPLGEDFFSAALEAIESARHYIFLEFFIIQEGKMWDTLLEALVKKAKQGVRVRVLYDDVGCFFLLPDNYPKKLRALGLECATFNPFVPFLTTRQNNRDHRKILSVDGRVAFTGGVNLADEYINHIHPFGHWKDTALRLEGPGAWGLTVMFLQMWHLATGSTEDAGCFYPGEDLPRPAGGTRVQPYCDSPLDKEPLGEQTYLQIIQDARRYLYITTPYLIIDEAMVWALTQAAKRGVEVKLVTPHRWDKRLVHITTRSYYRELLQGGVQIFEYTPGFIHSKVFVSDDRVATVGTVNLDYRSLYLHFECGVCLYGGPTVEDIRRDTEKTLAQSQPITPENFRPSFPARILQALIRLFAPLM